MNRFNKIMLGILAAILLTAMTVEPPKIKVYLITSYRGNDLTIEKVYLKKENLKPYTMKRSTLFRKLKLYKTT